MLERDQFMDIIIQAIRSHKSIRGYKLDPVPKEVLKDILDVAICAPSGENVQPWEITVVAREALDRIRVSDVEMFKSGAIPFPELASKPYEEQGRGASTYYVVFPLRKISCLLREV